MQYTVIIWLTGNCNETSYSAISGNLPVAPHESPFLLTHNLENRTTGLIGQCAEIYYSYIQMGLLTIDGAIINAKNYSLDVNANIIQEVQKCYAFEPPYDNYSISLGTKDGLQQSNTSVNIRSSILCVSLLVMLSFLLF